MIMMRFRLNLGSHSFLRSPSASAVVRMTPTYFAVANTLTLANY